MVTRSIRVLVQPQYLEDQSNPDEDEYVWSYTIQIENEGVETVQLRDRYWKITDAMGNVEEVRGPGVVGEQPILNPGDKFQYTSGCPLGTSSGIMVGNYSMVNDKGTRFQVDIPAFSLDLPGARTIVN